MFVVDNIEVLSGCLSVIFMLYSVLTLHVCFSLTAAERLEKSLNEGQNWRKSSLNEGFFVLPEFGVMNDIMPISPVGAS